MLKSKGHHQWSSNIFRHYKDAGKGMLEGPSHVQVELYFFFALFFFLFVDLKSKLADNTCFGGLNFILVCPI